MFKLKITFLALAAMSSIAGAATQGTLGSTSTGTFVNTFSGGTRLVQVLDLKDSIVTPTSPNVPGAILDNRPGAFDRFCVVDTSGGAVKLTMTSNHGRSGASAHIAKSAAGNNLLFNQSILIDGGPSSGTDLDTTGFTIPAANVVRSPSACGSGNLSKSVTIGDGTVLQPSDVYTAVMTVVASPI